MWIKPQRITIKTKATEQYYELVFFVSLTPVWLLAKSEHRSQSESITFHNFVIHTPCPSSNTMLSSASLTAKLKGK